MPAVVGVLAVEVTGSPRNLLSLSTTITFETADLPEDVVALVDAHLLDLGGTYGDPQAGDLIQCDELHIEHDQGDVEIVVFNRAVLLFTTDSEGVRRIHQVCCRLA